ncbi:hypothetical protein PR003_g10126 [Phytophthora rubi]|uniref:Uncharacterized protein n=1 Tax=Phytophthora rubi TaxID=129364 RepID=A0A6A4FQ93_9STRA|nr:hypothetical protein PR002_g14447 [Phytophthora rubi]KAE9019986.1 hypothetical protein PR001_g13732 [Phytophthora rubi]KAE9341152.1 hypothetical protein PR003_g10126 [Phytophthora rubi]
MMLWGAVRARRSLVTRSLCGQVSAHHAGSRGCVRAWRMVCLRCGLGTSHFGRP